MLKLAVLVSGGGTNLQAIIDRIEDGSLKNVKISVVISNNPKAYALQRAKDHGVKGLCLAPSSFAHRNAYHEALLKTLKGYEIDMIVLAGFLVQIPSNVIAAYPGKIINVHPSLIPAFCGKGYYGLKVHKAVLERGVKITGATVHIVDEGTDTGPILLQKAVEVKRGDTSVTLQKRVMEEAEWKILPEAIRLFAEQGEGRE